MLDSFSRVNANPGPETVKGLLKNIGIKNPFAAIEKNFEKYYKMPVAKGFIQGTLTNILSKRNEVAHDGFALNISRKDISDWLRFLESFARATDNALRDHTRSIIVALGP